MPAFTPTGKLANIQNLRPYIDFHVTLLIMNLYVATAFTYLSQVPHIPISCTALPEIIEELQINSIPESFFTRNEGYAQQDMKLFSYSQCERNFMSFNHTVLYLQQRKKSLSIS
jgi:hypothetical protein